ncbi:glycosyltransferase family 2 protein [Pseudooceanicola onchidii]|uniref:glycosyltransferase family 2 protein n=1 Tax=Pseudooceanicola onchidii TaxID=2562279 RepID=UPI0010AAFE56|nr:glycosyltransferase [Pseudooceanicola onchidii]
MTTPPVSVIVVSRGRGESLGLTLTGLSRLFHDHYEIVVVADAEGQDAVRRAGLQDEVKVVPFADPNISAARNRGIMQAAGEIIAFIDDDAVPEPSWLSYLTAPFTDPEVAAVGGFVIGRNGISFQWKASSVDHTGSATPLAVDETRATALTPPAGRAIKTEGTNMAFRRSVLAGLGGFDPAYRFFLDETDLNMRLAKAGYVTAIAPMARVHHAFAASPRRAASRAPTDLFEIGASLSVYLRRHCPVADRAHVVAAFTKARDRSLIDHMVVGRLEPRDVRRLRRRLAEGIAAGQQRPLTPLPDLGHSAAAFRPFETRIRQPSVTIAGRIWQGRRLRAQAAAKAAQGACVSLFLLSHTTRRHRVRMRPDGVWEQTGGLWGRSDRRTKIMRLTTFRKRISKEIQRISLLRGL